MPQIEAFVRPIPESPKDFIPKEAVLMGVEAAPRSIISDIVVNDAARELLPKDVQYLASPDYFAKNILMSVPAGEAPHHILSPVTSGRCVPVAFGVIPFGDKLGRVISGKGSWVSGNLVQGDDFDFVGLRHAGLLSVEGAKYDTNLSNALLADGFRSSLHLGYCVFNGPELKSWIRQKWANKSLSSKIDSSFAQLDKDLGDPAYLFRIGGSTERQVGPIMIGGQNVDNRKISEMRLASRLLLLESQTPGFQLNRIMNRSEEWIRQDVLDATAALTKLATGTGISGQEFTAYMHMLFYIYAENIIALGRENYSGLDIDQLSLDKDTDLGIFAYDYDAAFPDNESALLTAHQRMIRYVKRVKYNLSEYIMLITQCTKGYFDDTAVYRDVETYIERHLSAFGIIL